jgi:aromatic-L-amino-acid/L-tryptophan decarboxylase
MKKTTLDPENWDDFRLQAHRALDVMIDRLQSLDDAPAWRPMPDGHAAVISEQPVPWQGIGEAASFELFQQRILTYPNGSWHPRFWGWVQGTGIPWAMVADMLTSGMNAHLAGFNQAPKWVEHQVVSWVAQMLGWPSTSEGLLSSGATMSNLIALGLARTIMAQHDVRKHGMTQQSDAMTLYCSDQTHGWIDKAAEVLGIGTDSVRKIESDDQGRIRLDRLRQSIDQDRSDGRHPFCICGNAGTVHFGATDDLQSLADLSAERNMWFHVDGAFGAFAYLVPALRSTLAGMERADSLALDLHKWMYLPFDIGCLLVQRPQALARAFAMRQTYMTPTDRGLLAGGVPFADHGIELSRPFRALKAWMCLQAYGVQAFADCIEANVAQARYLAERLRADVRWQIVAPVPLNIVCFRRSPEQMDERQTDELNRELLLRLQESGVAVMSSTMIDGRFAIRACFTNHRTTMKDVDFAVDALTEMANALVAEQGS